jgi:predicted amidophosphoribosyltransferase
MLQCMSSSSCQSLRGRAVVLLLGVRCGGCGVRGRGMPCAACDALIRSSPRAPGAAFVDAGPLARIVRRSKQGAWRGGERYLARLMAHRLAEQECDLVTWVPADPRRRAARGGHLPERLARSLARELGVPSARLLERRGRRRPQRGLPRAERLRNVDGAFAPTRASRRDLERCRVLLVDDVRTTGATLHACATALAPHVASVHAVALVGVDRDARDAMARCQDVRSEREFRAQESNDPCRCHRTRIAKGPTRLVAPRPP